MPLYKPSPSLLAISANAQEASTTVGPAGSFKWNYEDKQLHIYDGVTVGGVTRSFEADFVGSGSFIYDGTTYSSGDTLTVDTFGESTFTALSTFTATIKMWGAGGGGANESPGGRGGYTYGEYTFVGGNTYTIWVGEGGETNSSSTSGRARKFGGGGLVGITNNSGWYRGTGGGLTGLFEGTATHANSIMIAGGGGGGGGTHDGYPTTATNPGGGDGGGTTGGYGADGGYGLGGYGGTQTAGGVFRFGSSPSYNSYGTSGAALSGGDGASGISTLYTGSGGGGGYYGGAGAGGNNYSGGGGGGGSGYLDSSVTNGQTINGNSINNKTTSNFGTIPGSTESEWNGSAGKPVNVTTTAGESAPDGQISIIVA